MKSLTDTYLQWEECQSNEPQLENFLANYLTYKGDAYHQGRHGGPVFANTTASGGKYLLRVRNKSGQSQLRRKIGFNKKLVYLSPTTQG